LGLTWPFGPLAAPACPAHAPVMFVVSEGAFDQGGELSAAVELRRLFPGVTDNAKARECARTIAGWQPLPAAACQITRLHPSMARTSSQRHGVNQFTDG
jgi:hypothetical protein